MTYPEGTLRDPIWLADGSALWVDSNGKLRYYRDTDRESPDADSDGSIIPDGSLVEIDHTDSPYTITDSSPDTIIADTDGGAVTIHMPTLADNLTRLITIKNCGTSGNDVTADGEGAEKMDGDATKTISDLSAGQFVATSQEWNTV
jgi:hypothetical protein